MIGFKISLKFAPFLNFVNYRFHLNIFKIYIYIFSLNNECLALSILKQCTFQTKVNTSA